MVCDGTPGRRQAGCPKSVRQGGLLTLPVRWTKMQDAGESPGLGGVCLGVLAMALRLRLSARSGRTRLHAILCVVMGDRALIWALIC